MRPREPRRKVLLNARMRLGASWGNARILNISSRGLLIEGESAPPRGSYVEVRRGQHVIVARVIWTDSSRFGLFTQDPLSVEQIVSEPNRAAAPCPGTDAALVERRSAARIQEAHAQRLDASRQAGRAFQFAAMVAFGTSAAVAAYEGVQQSLACPMSQVTAALSHDEAPSCETLVATSR